MRAAAVLLAAGVILAPSAAAGSSSCTETSEVVGSRLCSRYGDRWSAERLYRLVLSAGVWSGHLSPLSRNWSGAFGKDPAIKFAMPARALGIDAVDDVGVDLRMHGYLSRHVYLGFDWALALGSLRTTYDPQPNVEVARVGGLNFVHAKLGGVVGARLPLGPLSARLESVIGFEVASITAKARRPGQAEWIRGSFTSVNFLLEPRVAVDLWTSPWTTVSVWGGMNMVYPSERSMGLSFALHARAFDGARRL